MTTLLRLCSIAALLLSLICLPTWADDAEDKEEKPEVEPKTLAETVESFEKLDGFFTLYRDPDGNGEYDSLAKAAAFTEVNRIDGWMKKHRRHSQASRDYNAFLIEQGLDD